MVCKKFVRLPTSPKKAMVEFSLTGKLISQPNSNVTAMMLDVPQTMK
jgi:hypothetical protein